MDCSGRDTIEARKLFEWLFEQCDHQIWPQKILNTSHHSILINLEGHHRLCRERRGHSVMNSASATAVFHIPAIMRDHGLPEHKVRVLTPYSIPSAHTSKCFSVREVEHCCIDHRRFLRGPTWLCYAESGRQWRTAMFFKFYQRPHENEPRSFSRT